MNQNFYVENNKNQKIFNKLKKVNILFNDPLKWLILFQKIGLILMNGESKETLICKKTSG